jgi:heptosyltransferase I
MVFMRIAIVKLSALGDIVHAMSVLQFIKKFNNEISIHWIVEEIYKDLLDSNPDINQVHTVNLREAQKKKSLFIFIAELRKLRKLGTYDIVIDMQGLIKSALISKLIPSKKTIGFDKESAREGLASLFYSDKCNFSYSKNVIDRNNGLIEFALGLSIGNAKIQKKVPFLFTTKCQLEIELSITKKNILIVPGASHISKCYPPSKLAKLTSQIDANFIVIWGSNKEKIMANEIRQLSQNVSICNKLQLDSLVLLISKVDLVIGPDTGPTHMAWALNIPSITLFGPTPGYRNTYSTKINHFIESKSEVNPYKINKKDYSIKDISLTSIVEEAKNLLNL